MILKLTFAPGRSIPLEPHWTQARPGVQRAICAAQGCKILSDAVCCRLNPDEESSAARQLLSDAHSQPVRAPPTCLGRPARVFPTSPQGCESGHCTVKALSLLCGEKHRCTKNTWPSGTHPPSSRVEQLWLKLSCFAVGSQGNARRTASDRRQITGVRGVP